MAEEEREVKPHIVLYTQAGCGPCQVTKMYVEQKNIECTMIEVDTDIDRDLLLKIYPTIEDTGFPFCTVDGAWVPDLIIYCESGL